MQKINSIFLDLLNCRKSSAIPFNEAGENEAYSAKVYWEYLNRLDEAIKKQIESFGFSNRIVIKDNIVQIEIYLPESAPPEHTPYAVFQFGYTNDMPQTAQQFYHKDGEFSWNETFQNFNIIDVEQIHALFDNLKKDLKICNNPLNLMEAADYWSSIIEIKKPLQ